MDPTDKPPDTRLATLAGRTPSASPAFTLVTRMGTKVSRESIKASLRVILRLARPGEAKPDLLSFPWHRLDYQTVGAIRNRLAEKYAPASANRHLAALRGVLKEAWKLGLLPSEELARALLGAERVEGHREPPGRMITDGERQRMLKAASSRPGAQGLRDAAILAVGLGAGLRRHELVELTVDGVLSTSQEVRVIGKGNKQRTVPLPPWAWERVEAWATRRAKAAPTNSAGQEQPFFCGLGRRKSFSREGGTPLPAHRLSTSGMTVILNGIAEEAGIKDFMTHNLRRTFISSLWDADVDAASVATLAGHGSVDTSIKYDRRGHARLRKAVDKAISDPMKPSGGK